MLGEDANCEKDPRTKAKIRFQQLVIMYEYQVISSLKLSTIYYLIDFFKFLTCPIYYLHNFSSSTIHS